MLWVALHLPCLSLEAFIASVGEQRSQASDPFESAVPVALLEMHRLVELNAIAEALGLRVGMKRATALALAPHVVLGEAQITRDQAAICAVAHAALEFTPQVTFEVPDSPEVASRTVLLEVQASLRYFGGLSRLLRRLHAAVLPLRHCVHAASAPTARGAALLACTDAPRQGRHATDLIELARRLDEAPVWLLGPGREHWQSMQGMGLQTLRDLRRLPRSGLARRFGAALLDELDRAYGDRPDPRETITPPETFDSRLELFARADTTEQVLHGAAMLLQRLLAWCRAQQGEVRRFTLVMQHEARHRPDARTPPDTRLEIALAEPSSEASHLQVLLRERLAQVQLVAPTLELRVQCSDLARRAPPNQELFPTARGEREGIVRLIERLQARLGVQQVQWVVAVDDHRPERATRCEAVDAARLPSRASSRAMKRARSISRPVWLLAEPQPLREHPSQPWLEGHPLQLLCGPERIEAGWWDNKESDPIARDYFIAQAADAALVWVFRERLPPLQEEAIGWFLQGRFG